MASAEAFVAFFGLCVILTSSKYGEIYRQAAMLKAREIKQDEYDCWRYHHYPEFDTTQRWAKVPSQGLSDLLVEALKEEED